MKQASFFSVDSSNHTLVGGASVNRHWLILRQRCLLLRCVCDILNAVPHFARDVRCFAFSSWMCV